MLSHNRYTICAIPAWFTDLVRTSVGSEFPSYATYEAFGLVVSWHLSRHNWFHSTMTTNPSLLLWRKQIFFLQRMSSGVCFTPPSSWSPFHCAPFLAIQASELMASALSDNTITLYLMKFREFQAYVSVHGVANLFLVKSHYIIAFVAIVCIVCCPWCTNIMCDSCYSYVWSLCSCICLTRACNLCIVCCPWCTNIMCDSCCLWHMLKSRPSIRRQMTHASVLA